MKTEREPRREEKHSTSPAESARHTGCVYSAIVGRIAEVYKIGWTPFGTVCWKRKMLWGRSASLENSDLRSRPPVLQADTVIVVSTSTLLG